MIVQIRLYNLILSLILIFTLYSCKNEKIEKINPLKSEVDSLQNVIYCQEEEIERLYEMIDSLPLGPPLDTLILSSNYGWRRSPLTGGWQMHSGTDYLAAWYDTVYASGDGVVIKVGWNLGYGRQIRIKHLLGYESSYSHLYRYFVENGDSVKIGQPIGRAGNSGSVTGPHLHYEISRNGIKTNPIPYIRNQK